MEPTTEFVREPEESPQRDTTRERPGFRLSGWEWVVFELEDEREGDGIADGGP